MRQKKRNDTTAFTSAVNKKKKPDGSDDEEAAGDEDDPAKKAQKELEEKKNKAKKEIEKIRTNQKVGRYGYILPAKGMLYNPDNDKIEPESRGGKQPQISDYNVLRKGPAGTLELTTKMRN